MQRLRKNVPKNRKFFLWTAGAILILFLGIFALNVLDDDGEGDDILVDQDKVGLLFETASSLEKALNYLDQIDGFTFFDKIQILHQFLTALKNDIDMAAAEKSPMVLLRSHTLELIGNFGLGKLPDLVTYLKKVEKLPVSFKLPATFGVEDFVTAIARHIGSGKVDIDTITSYLDGVNKACWAIVGYLVGGAKGAQLFQDLAGTTAKLMREATLPLFEKGVLLWRKQGKKLVQTWLKQQERRIEKGQAVQRITEVYPEELLRENGIDRRQIKELNDLAHILNQKRINMKRDLTVEKLKVYSEQGKAKLGGVEISPVPVKSGVNGKEQKKEVLDSRDSENSLSWPIKNKK